MSSGDLFAALQPVIEALEDAGARCYVGGSLASSFHGLPRASIDADVVADLRAEHVRPLIERLQGSYYIDEGRVRAAVASRRSFNVIHLETMFKVDVFVTKGRPYDRTAFDRARAEALAEPTSRRAFPLASPEDTVLAKLEWFRAGGEVSDRQWADIVGVLKTAWTRLDHDYLSRWAPPLGVEDLLDRARDESKPQPP